MSLLRRFAPPHCGLGFVLGHTFALYVASSKTSLGDWVALLGCSTPQEQGLNVIPVNA